MARRLPIALLLAAAVSRGGWAPDSPILRVGDDLDVYFTTRARVEYSSNIFLGNSAGLPNSGASWTVGPGFSADFFKESMFSSSLSWRRDLVRYFDSALKGLHDDQDIGGASVTYDGGGPLTLQLAANYGEGSSNRAEGDVTTTTLFDPSGTLLRQTNYSQSATLGYRLTEKLNLSLVASHASNRYDPLDKVNPAFAGEKNTEGLTESEGWSFPLSLKYAVGSRLSIGLSYEHGHTNVRNARGSSGTTARPGFTKDFYGVTLSGQPTSSGKLDVVLKGGVLRSVFDGGLDASSKPSYSATLTHTLTEKTNHSLSLRNDATVAINGSRNETQAANYTLNYAVTESFRASASVGMSLNKVGVTDIRSGSFGLNATLTPDSHWTYVASYALTQSYRPNSYDAHQFSLEANLRW